MRNIKILIESMAISILMFWFIFGGYILPAAYLTSKNYQIKEIYNAGLSKCNNTFYSSKFKTIDRKTKLEYEVDVCMSTKQITIITKAN